MADLLLRLRGWTRGPGPGEPCPGGPGLPAGHRLEPAARPEHSDLRAGFPSRLCPLPASCRVPDGFGRPVGSRSHPRALQAPGWGVPGGAAGASGPPGGAPGPYRAFPIGQASGSRLRCSTCPRGPGTCTTARRFPTSGAGAQGRSHACAGGVTHGCPPPGCSCGAIQEAWASRTRGPERLADSSCGGARGSALQARAFGATCCQRFRGASTCACRGPFPRADQLVPGRNRPAEPGWHGRPPVPSPVPG